MAHEPVSRFKRGAARRLRRDMTDAERKLWAAIKAHRPDGVGFRRQTPMGAYVVDFVSHRMRLVIELDGGQHGLSENAEDDRRRDAWLVSRGYKVLRFWNNDVLTNLEGVMTAIFAALPPSQPSPARGEGFELAAPVIDDAYARDHGEPAVPDAAQGKSS